MRGIGHARRSGAALCVAGALIVGGLGTGTVAARGTLDQEYDALYGPATGTNFDPLAQTFTAGMTGDLDAIELAVYTGYVSTAKVEIRSVVGGQPTGALLASVTQVLPAGAAWMEIAFSSPARVTAGSQYAIVLNAPTPMWFHETTGYAGGRGFGIGATDDFGFRTYVTPIGDTTPPTTWVTGVTPGATYVLGNVPEAGCMTSDDDSGVATEATLTSAYTGGVGPASVTCSGAVDQAGNAGDSATVAFRVVYDFAGPYQPVDAAPMLNVAKAGSAIPVRFGLAGDQGLAILAAGYPVSGTIACDTTQQLDALEETVSAGASGLSYDASTDTYTYVWKSSKAWANSCRALVLTLDDGSRYITQFMFK